ncbi:hypothetical protein [Microbacterium imperiale]|uniref:Uncharacterized protein n=1 Tax=Microbacterium imperiale TaxID=33884 RepID=A0A9W6HDW9_9MICO|nr:hypothetical protein [Microbacterium imperiale]MBP2419986.1 hypothetical protein [Microbacterium imperiale]MDS0198150.1 hypothetical protein [Microbacterium imperiale]BFE40328.1 hypothetical protein GCM10017544_12840 [Microbacterium imperiale]GLJ78696.1 hypothetical protein GCM10017586_03780 [Microbacterium imperiale]
MTKPIGITDDNKLAPRVLRAIADSDELSTTIAQQLGTSVEDAQAAAAAAIAAVDSIPETLDTEDAAIAALLATDSESRRGAEAALAQLRAPGPSINHAPLLNAFLKLNEGRGGTLLGDFTLAGTVFWPKGRWDLSRATFKAAAGWSGYPFQAECQRLAVMSPRSMSLNASATGGALAAGTYFYSVTAVTETGETIGAPVKNVTLTGSASSVGVSWAAPIVPDGAGAVTGYRVWRGHTGRLQLIATTTETSYTDTGAEPSAELFPAVNSSFTRTAGIEMFGGVLDVNGPNRPCDFNWPESGKYAGHGIDFQHVDDLVIDGIKVMNATKWAIAIADFGNIRTDNLVFDTDSDGIHVLGPGKTWTSSHVRGHRSGDDVYGLSLAEWPTYAVSRGSIESVEFNDLWSVNGHSFIRVLGAADYTIGKFKVDGVKGEYSGQFRGGIYVWDNLAVGSWPNGTDIGIIDIQNVDVVMTDAPTAPFPFNGEGQHPPVVLSGRELGMVRLSKIKGRSKTANKLRGLVQFGTGNSDTTQVIQQAILEQLDAGPIAAPFGVVSVRGRNDIRMLPIDQARVDSPDATSQLVKVFDATSRVRVLEVSRPSVVGLANSGAFVEVATGATVNRLSLRDITDFNTYRVADIYAGTHVDEVFVDGVASKTAGEIVRIATTDPCVVHTRDMNLPNIPNAPVRGRAGAKLTVISSGGNVLPVDRLFVFPEAGIGSIRASGPDVCWQFGLATLSPRAGDMLYNANPALSGGKGLCVYDGSAAWKNLVTGGTWPNA